MQYILTEEEMAALKADQELVTDIIKGMVFYYNSHTKKMDDWPAW